MFAREYELIYIVRPDVAEEDLGTVQERTDKIIAERGGTVLKVDDWGSKRLAYDIQKHGKGHFVLFNFLSEPDTVTELERTLRIDDKVLRFLTVKVHDRVDVDTRVAKEEADREAAETAVVDADGVARD
jgi:small subunit ribosomal protein S6